MTKMVQVFMVLRCFSCETFQVHQVKKSSNKWSCKICNEKQSVKKVYGQGAAADCRKHVQKLNMLRGKKEASEQQLLNHPPEDYAATFEKEDSHRGDEPRPDHPVLLTGKESKWKLFTEPQDSASEEEPEEAGGCATPYTTDKRVFEEAHKKKKRDQQGRTTPPLCRHKHDSDHSKPHPLSKAARGQSLTYKPPSSSTHFKPRDSIHPYSSVSDKMGTLLSGLKSSKSCYLYSSNDRYQRLSDDSFPDSGYSISQSVQNLSSYHKEQEPNDLHGLKPCRMGMSQEDRIASIREDIGRFSRPDETEKGIPVASSRWSKFMNESEEEEEEDEEEEEEREEEREGEGVGDGVNAHLLQSRSAVAKYKCTS